jgi:TolB protein
MTRIVYRLCLLVLFVSASMHAPVFAQQVHIDVEAGGFARMKVASPAFSGPAEQAQGMWNVCARDLALTGLFDVIDPKAYVNPGPAGRIVPEAVKDYALIGADYALAASVTIQGDSVLFRAHMVEVATAAVVDDTIYTCSAREPHRAVHLFMNRLMKDKFGLMPLFSTKIACIRKVDNAKQLHLMWCDGTGGATIRGGGSLVLNPAWSPDGGRIALVSYYRNNPDLYIFDRASYRLRLVSAERGINTSPAFHPRGGAIGLTLSIDGNPEIYLLDLSGGGRTRLTRSWATDTSPSFSPDGKAMAFCSSRAGNPNIFLMNLSTQAVTRLTYEGKYNSEPAFSPRGDLIAFSCLGRDGRYRIAVVKPDGSGFRVLKGTGRGDESPAFSPDGRLIAFAASDGAIYVTDLMGEAVLQVTSPGGYSEPAWSPVLRD